MACDEIVETVCIIVDGTRKRNEIIFSTIPTAALISTPRLFAIIVIMRKATWIKPSCKLTGIPIFRMDVMVSFSNFSDENES